MISLEALEKTYQANTRSFIPVLKGITLDIKPREIIGIIAKKGAGKTTLFRCLALLEQPSRGTVLVDRYCFSHSKQKNDNLMLARQSIGLVCQETQLFDSKTVYENIALPLELSNYPKPVIEENVRPLLNLLGLTDKSNAYPTMLNSAERKRVGLARALVNKPKILLIDDPTTELEAKSFGAFLQLLKEINERYKISIVVCTSEIDVIKTICHRVAVMHQGEIIEESDTQTFFTKPKSMLGKEWVRASTRLELPTALRRRLKPTAFESSHPVLRLSFIHNLGNNAGIQNTTQDASTDSPDSIAFNESLIAHVVQEFNLTINIMQAHIEPLRDESIAVMIIEVEANHNLDAAIQFLENQSLFVEVLGYATRTH